MGLAAIDGQDWGDAPTLTDQRVAPRFIALIRAAKLVSDAREYICVVSDVSTSGVRLRCFHPIPYGQAMNLELQNGDSFALERVRDDGHEASFRFPVEVSVERLLQVTMHHPRRPLRLNMAIPLTLRTLAGPIAAVTENISQQGCRVQCTMPLALAQSVIVDVAQLPSIRAKVQWRRSGACGLVFDDTYSLKDFAIQAARLQSSSLATV